MKAIDYRTLATREPVVVPAVEAWRRKARWRERWSLAPWQLAMALPVLGVVALAFVQPIAAVFVGVVFAAPLPLIISEYLRFRRDRAVRIVLRFDRVWAVPNRSHWHGRALAACWKALVGHSEALGIANPETFLAVASDTVTWFPVREGLDVFDAITAAGCLPADEQDELALLMETLAAAPPPSPSVVNDAPSPAPRTDASDEPLRFRLEYVDGRDSRSANELLASGYCVGQTRPACLKPLAVRVGRIVGLRLRMSALQRFGEFAVEELVDLGPGCAARWSAKQSRIAKARLVYGHANKVWVTSMALPDDAQV